MKKAKRHQSWRVILCSLITILLILSVSAPVFADSGGGDPPPDPGVGTQQDETKADSVQWYFPGGIIYFIDDDDGDIELDWSDVDLENTTAPVEGVIPLTGLGSEPSEDDCGAGGGFGSCQTQQLTGLTPDDIVIPEGEVVEKLNLTSMHWMTDTIHKFRVRNPNDFAVAYTYEVYGTDQEGWGIATPGDSYFYITGSHGSPNTTKIYWKNENGITFQNTKAVNQDFYVPVNMCPDVFVEPGVISLSGRQINPEYAVVIGQDPDENGVTVEWIIDIHPTVVTYFKWQIIGDYVAACLERPDEAETCTAHCDECPEGWVPVIEKNWGCAEYVVVLPEGINSLDVGASLSLNSRAWISGELASAYPGAHLINPDWSFSAPEDCTWSGDVCSIVTTATIPVTDPGWYDIRFEGITAGTSATPPRSFMETAGTFSVFLVDTSTIQ